jgi:hypothetical protein
MRQKALCDHLALDDGLRPLQSGHRRPPILAIDCYRIGRMPIASGKFTVRPSRQFISISRMGLGEQEQEQEQEQEHFTFR